MKHLKIVIRPIVLILFISIIYSCNKEREVADTIIINSKIWTGNPDHKFAEAFAVKGDTILAIGSDEEILELKSDKTKVIDLEGKFVTPGFIDSHLHFLTGGFNLSSVQLRDASTPEELKKRIKEYAESTEAGTWILGGDWDHKNWGGELPTKEWIDEFTQNNPVFISRLDGHMALANSAAMKFAGIDKNIKDVEGGSIGRNDKGNLTGIFKDNAMLLIQDKIPAPTEKQTDLALQNAMNYVASHGVTSAHHMVGYMDALKRAQQNNSLITRLYVAHPIEEWKNLKEKIEKEGNGDKWLKIGGLKGFIDGSLGSHTAAFKEPYTDKPTEKGFFVESRKDIYNWVKNADNEGLQVMIHAIGDSAVHFLLDTYEKVGKENGEKDRRFRIEHAQHLLKEDIPRFAELNVIPSMQPYHAIDDGRWAEKVIGKERAKTTYAFKSLFENNTKVAFGSDWFVAPPVPLFGIYAAVTRRTLDDKNPDGWVPEQKISVEKALIAYTRNAAYASFDEDIKGTLEKGKLADFVVLSENLFEIAPEKIWDVKVLQTFVGGKKVYELEK
ncbi:MAG: amidohydrolase [Bacteroidota bacterium]